MAVPTLTPASQTSAVRLPVTGTHANVNTTTNPLPFGIYTGPAGSQESTDFVSGAVDQVAFVYKKLGGDVLDIELTQYQVYAAYEEAVLEYERERLRSINRQAEALMVRRISQLDVKAGYDIESFDGDKPLFDYDRFIEVKSSYNPRLRFFWSENERRAAEEKGDKYWIYFVGGLSSRKGRRIIPILIQNPATRLVQMSAISMKAATYLIEQSDEIQLRGFSQGKVNGYML